MESVNGEQMSAGRHRQPQTNDGNPVPLFPVSETTEHNRADDQQQSCNGGQSEEVSGPDTEQQQERELNRTADERTRLPSFSLAPSKPHLSRLRFSRIGCNSSTKS